MITPYRFNYIKWTLATFPLYDIIVAASLSFPIALCPALLTMRAISRSDFAEDGTNTIQFISVHFSSAQLISHQPRSSQTRFPPLALHVFALSLAYFRSARAVPSSHIFSLPLLLSLSSDRRFVVASHSPIFAHVQLVFVFIYTLTHHCLSFFHLCWIVSFPPCCCTAQSSCQPQAPTRQAFKIFFFKRQQREMMVLSMIIVFNNFNLKF